MFTYLLVLISVANAGERPSRHSLALHWGCSLPADRSFLSAPCFVTPSLEWDWRIVPAFSAGLGVGYMHASESGFTKDSYEGDPVSGYSERRLRMMPLTVHLRWMPLGDEKCRFTPYINLAGGGQYADFWIKGDQINASGIKKWGLLWTSALGCSYGFGPSRMVGLDVRCEWKEALHGWPLLDIKSDKSLNILLGVVVRLGKKDK